MIINSILDTDWYKIAMGQVVFYQFPQLVVRYKFIDRNNMIYPKDFAIKLQEEINHLSTLRLALEEQEWLSKQVGITKYYLNWFSNYSFNPKQVDIKQDEEGHLSIVIEGKWKETIYWEVPLLAIISELYYKETGCVLNVKEFIKKTVVKRSKLQFPFADFGTRRRFSFEAQNLLVFIMSSYEIEEDGDGTGTNPNFLGTSNPYLAKKYNVKPIGTTAHECVMAMSALYGVEEANIKWLENWRYIYGNNYNIALIDTFTTDYFFKTISTKDLQLLDGLRQDSGDPIQIGRKIIKYWKERGINPKDKKIVFSDNLNVEKATEIYNEFKDKTNVIFGIGTFLTNDCGYKPLNIVIKLDSVFTEDIDTDQDGIDRSYGYSWKSVVKLSDSKGKYTGNKETVKQILFDIGHCSNLGGICNKGYACDGCPTNKE